MNIGEAVQLMKNGKKLAREGWNGKDMFVCYMSGIKLPPYSTQGTNRKVNDRTAAFIGENTSLNTAPYLVMYNSKKIWQPGWVCSQEDILADDWFVVE